MGRKRSRDRGRSSGGVSRRALLGVLLAGGAGAAGIQGTGAFSSVTGDRQFGVQTADDTDALLGVRPREATGGDGESVPLFTLTNRFDGPLTLDRVSVVSSGGLGIGHGDVSVSSRALAPGEQADIEATLSCGSAVTDEVTVAISASNPSESIELRRSTTASCRQTGPDRCPVVPRVSVTVSESASGSVERDGDISLKNKDIDGDVISTEGTDGDVGLKNVSITGRVEASGGIGTFTNAEVGETARANGDIATVKNSIVGGDVVTVSGSDGDIGLKNSEVAGGVESAGGIGTFANTEVGGTVRANGDIGSSMKNSAVGGDVVTADGSDGDIEIKSSTVCGTIDADGGVGELKNTDVGGDVVSNGDVDVGNSSEVFGDIVTNGDGDITVGSGSTVGGNLDAAGDITVSGTVEGTVTADGDVTIESSGTVGGDVDADGDVTVDGTVEGDVSAGGNIDGESYESDDEEEEDDKEEEDDEEEEDDD